MKICSSKNSHQLTQMFVSFYDKIHHQMHLYRYFRALNNIAINTVFMFYAKEDDWIIHIKN